jgi:hypothetical protein
MNKEADHVPSALNPWMIGVQWTCAVASDDGMYTPQRQGFICLFLSVFQRFMPLGKWLLNQGQ